MLKKLIVNRYESQEERQNRYDQLAQWVSENQSKSVSLRVYRSADDDKILVEKWVFSDQSAADLFWAETEDTLGPWPDGNNADGFGKLIPVADKEWDE